LESIAHAIALTNDAMHAGRLGHRPVPVAEHASMIAEHALLINVGRSVLGRNKAGQLFSDSFLHLLQRRLR
jgi:hypothetical protein